MDERKRTRVSDLHKRWLKTRPDYARAVEVLEHEFELARKIIAARKEAGLTQEAVARRMNTTQTAIARLESGEKMPSTRTLERFAEATGHALEIGFAKMKGKLKRSVQRGSTGKVTVKGLASSARPERKGSPRGAASKRRA